MSQHDVQIMRRAYDAFNRQDIPAVLAAFDRDIEWVEQGGGRAPVGTFRGSQSVADSVFATIPPNFDAFAAEPAQFIDAGDHVVVVGQFRGKAKGGATLDAPFVHAWRMRDGKAASFRNYVDSGPWVSAWGG